MGFSTVAVPAHSVLNWRGELIECSDQKVAKHLGETLTPKSLFSNPLDDFGITYELGDNGRLYVTYLIHGANEWLVLEKVEA